MKRLFVILIVLVLGGGVHAQSALWKQLAGPYTSVSPQVESTPDGGLFSYGKYWDPVKTEWRTIYFPLSYTVSTGLVSQNNIRFTVEHSGALLYYSIFPPSLIHATGGIYRSTDQGKTWTFIYEYGDNKPYFVSILSSPSGALYGFMASSLVLPTAETKIYRSLDHGASWELLTSIGLPSLQHIIDENDNCYFPVNQPTLAVVRYDMKTNLYKAIVPAKAITDSNCRIVLHHGTLFARSNHGFYKILPTGIWQQQSELTPASTVLSTSLYGGSGDYLFTSVALSDGMYKLLASTSSGSTWDTVQLPNPAIRPSHICFDSSGAYYLSSMTYPNSSPDVVAGIYRSVSPVNSWRAFGTPSYGFPILSEGPNGLLNVEAIPYGMGRDWNQENGQFCSSDSGRTWSKTVTAFPTLGRKDNSLPNSLAGTFFKDPEDGFYYFGATQPNSSTNKSTISFADEQHPFDFQIQTSQIAVYSSPVTCGWGHTFYATLKGGIYKTTDHGISWDEIVIPSTATSLSTIATDNTGRLYAGYGPAIYRTSNEGVSWEKLQTGIKDARISTVRFVGASTIIVGTTGSSIWRSTDNGSNWQQWKTPSDTVYNIEISGARCFATTDKGLVSCDLNSSNWIRELPLDEDRPAVGLLKMSDGRLYTSLAYSGIWTTDPSYQATVIQHTDRTGVGILLTARCKAGEITITYSTPESAQTKIALYDLLGRELDVIADEYIAAGETVVSKKLPSLPSGSYFVLVSTPTGRSMCKVIK